MNGYLKTSLQGQQEKEERLLKELAVVKEKLGQAQANLAFLAYRQSQELSMLEKQRADVSDRVCTLRNENNELDDEITVEISAQLD